ncbi:MAG: penicillin-binding protein [Blastocatellia bacterium]
MSQLSGEERSSRYILWLGLLLASWMMVIIWRLAWVQIVQHAEYSDRAEQNYTKRIRLLPERGSIVDRNGQLLAMSVIVKSVFVDPVLLADLRGKFKTPESKLQKIEEKRQLAVKLLSPLLGIGPSELYGMLTGSNRHLWLKRNLDVDKADAVRIAVTENRLTGIQVVEEEVRSYPNQALAAHLLGYTGIGAGDQEESNGGEATTPEGRLPEGRLPEQRLEDGQRLGLAGVERRYDKLLRGKHGEVTLLTNARGEAYQRLDLPPAAGATVHLTIDSVLQRKAEMLLDQAIRQHRARGGGVIVMNPATGEILALANAPTFDPNRIEGNVTTNTAYINQAVMSPYEPGSIFKVIAYAAGFEEGIIRPDDLIDCGNGQISIGSRVIHDTHSYGMITVEEAFAKSSNVGAIRIAQRLGRETFHSYIKKFGFGDSTQIDLPAESWGILHPISRWRMDSIGSVAIGQEISVTLIQAVAAIATIANKGTWVQPHVVSKVVNPDNGALFYQSKVGQRRVISEQTAQLMTRILERVVTDGTGRHVQLEGYTVAGKTGTPQKPGKSGYGVGKYMPSFLGYVPATDPHFAIVVMIDEPSSGAYYGGVVAAPVFSRIAEAALGDHDVLPDDRKYREKLDRLAERYSGGKKSSGERVLSMADELSDGDDASGASGARVVGQVMQTSAVIPGGPGPGGPGSGGPGSGGPGSAGQIARSGQPVSTGGGGQRGGSGMAVSGVVSNGAEMVMPDLRGQGSRRVTRACVDLQLKLKLNGSGLAVSQYPSAGARVRPGDECRVVFR